MTLKLWDSPAVGVYYRRYAGHDLEIRRKNLTSRKSTDNRPYEVIVDGISVSSAWNTHTASNIAIRVAESIESNLQVNLVKSALVDNKQDTEADRQIKSMTDSESIELSPGSNLQGMPVSQPGGCSGGVSFSITGVVDGMSPADALIMVRAVVEILRQHANVKCSVVLPDTITL